ncbi:hypothetical protein JW887_05910 [Candidatus Dojkabacteria bacterium]|nr:hypothetical protein [Candidatus Dojkabacteria bacterium]
MKIRPKPESKWIQEFLRTTDKLEDCVTINSNTRTSSSNIFNFFKLSAMDPKLKTILATVTIIVTLGAATGTIYASDAANPGDILYPLDKAVENVQRTFTLDPTKKAELEIAIMDERVSELELLSESDNTEAISDSISEVEAQQTRIQDKIQEMDQLRTEDKLQTQDQQRIMEQLQQRIKEQEKIMDKVQTKLKENGDNSNSDKLNDVKNKYSEKVDKQIQNFEKDTGIVIQENEEEQEENKNQNDGDTENQEQEQEQNKNQNLDNSQQNGNSTNQGSGQQGQTQ